jgi:YD repeat-containing protein
VINALNQITTYGYDAVGNQTSMTDALTHTTTYKYASVWPTGRARTVRRPR